MKNSHGRHYSIDPVSFLHAGDGYVLNLVGVALSDSLRKGVAQSLGVVVAVRVGVVVDVVRLPDRNPRRVHGGRDGVLVGWYHPTTHRAGDRSHGRGSPSGGLSEAVSHTPCGVACFLENVGH